MMTRSLTIVAVLLSLAAASAAQARLATNGVSLDGRAVPATSGQSAVDAVVLPSGETVVLR